MPAIVLALLVVAAAPGCGTSRPSDERAAAAPVPGGALALPAAAVAEVCSTQISRTPAGGPEPLHVFTRAQFEPDGLPALGGSFSWLPAGVVYPEQSRRPASDRFEKELHLVPVSGLRPPRCGGGSGEGNGVCLVVGAGAPAVRCFSAVEIGEGRGWP